jgi:hypothetical protein
VEAGLNEEPAVPFLMFFIALAVATKENIVGRGVVARFLFKQRGLGTLIGLRVGLAGGWPLGLEHRDLRRPQDRIRAGRSPAAASETDLSLPVSDIA